MKAACHYSILRFMPYRETEEFVNVGVVLVQPETGFFNYKLASKRKRISAFFHEFNMSIYRYGLANVRAELELLRDHFNLLDNGGQCRLMPEELLNAYTALIRTRESIFQYSTPRTVLCENAKQKLEETYAFFIDRQFAQDPEYQEERMVREVKNVFSAEGLLKYYREEVRLGTLEYGVTVPFCYSVGAKPIAAIKPLNLEKGSTTKIYDHGGTWLSRLRRLRDFHTAPEHMIFAVTRPSDGKRMDVACTIINELKAEDAQVVPFDQKQMLVNVARAEVGRYE